MDKKEKYLYSLMRSNSFHSTSPKILNVRRKKYEKELTLYISHVLHLCGPDRHENQNNLVYHRQNHIQIIKVIFFTHHSHYSSDNPKNFCYQSHRWLSV